MSCDCTSISSHVDTGRYLMIVPVYVAMWIQVDIFSFCMYRHRMEHMNIQTEP